MTQTLESAEIELYEHRFSRQDYYRIARMRLFNGKRVELIDGRIFTMAPCGNRREVALGLMARALETAFGESYWVRQQMSLNLKPNSAPEPDLAVIRGKVEEITTKPTTALLVVEISDKTLSSDTAVKKRLYASNDIPDYWILNLRDKCLEVYRNPVERPLGDFNRTGHFNFTYENVVVYHPSEVVSPLALGSAQINVADVIPPVNVAD